MSNRKLSTFELQVLVAVLDCMVVGSAMPDPAVPLMGKIYDSAKALLKNFTPVMNDELWAAARDPVFLNDPDMKGTNAIDFLLFDTILAKIVDEMAKKKAEALAALPPTSTTQTVVTQTTTTTAVLTSNDSPSDVMFPNYPNMS